MPSEIQEKAKPGEVMGMTFNTPDTISGDAAEGNIQFMAIPKPVSFTPGLEKE